MDAPVGVPLRLQITFSNCREQTGYRQVRIRRETAVAVFLNSTMFDWIVYRTSPD